MVKQQASWSTWEFDEHPVVRFFDNKLWIIFTYAEDVDDEIEAEELTDDTDPDVYLDRKIKFRVHSTLQTTITAFDSGSNKTTFTLPYDVAGKTIAVVRLDETKNSGLIWGDHEWQEDGGFIKETGPRPRLLLVVSSSWYEFNKAHKPSRDQAKQRLIGELSGRLQVAT